MTTLAVTPLQPSTINLGADSCKPKASQHESSSCAWRGDRANALESLLERIRLRGGAH